MGKTLATFRIEENDWNAFKEWADKKGSNASSEIIKFVLSSIGRIDGEISADALERRIDEYLDTNIDKYLDKRIDNLKSTSRDIDKSIDEYLANNLDKNIAEAVNSIRKEIQPLLETEKQMQELLGK